jgi:hypothetical protein
MLGAVLACSSKAQTTADAAVIDGPILDGPLIDAPLVDGRVIDASPTVDGPPADVCGAGQCLDPRCPADTQTIGPCSPIGLVCEYFENTLTCGPDGNWACTSYSLDTDHCHDFESREDAGSCAVTVHPCCGGPLPACIPPPDGGSGCPPGTTSGECYGTGGPQLGCYVPCTPAPPYCAPAGSSCPTECHGGCGTETATDWYCVCA